MRPLSGLALASLLGGIALLVYGAATGQAQVHLVLIFPVFTGTGLASFAGMLLIVLAMFLWFFSVAGPFTPRAPEPLPAQAMTPPSPSAPPPEPAPSRKFGGVVFLGPLPIVFGSDAGVAKYMLVLAIAMTVLLLAFFFLIFLGVAARGFCPICG